MIAGPTIVQALKELGVTHVVWIPDSELGTWEHALLAEPSLQLIRVTREGEAIGVAAGLMLGGKRPVVIIQSTGLFEAGDALRNVVHDLKLPLFLIVGLRSELSFQQRATTDTAPVFAEPMLQTWKLPYRFLETSAPAESLVAAYRSTAAIGQAGAVCVPE
jgi:sulfopyruvate decarboxylase TPP-binding subunit